MSTSVALKDSTRLFNVLDAQHEDWIVERAMEIVERRMFRGGQALQNSCATMDFLRTRLAQEPNEVFVALFMDNQNRVIAYEELFKGTVNSTSVYPRVVLSRVLAHNAAAIIFAHNHPSGLTDPSTADKFITTRLKVVLEAVDVRVLDHVIVGQGPPFSFAEKGLL
ncbi:RadC family protein [Klebsiella pneumoniae]|uniref:JAB domain-containing protein n=1 Tax=Klebsiella pneumoniae TaxID=573 RepID=UPI001ABCE849|nr:DNA repair protein RadC [Klebsiella pneumoniae]MBO3721237.1 DNA repair protein RadC [Klebsiella pneumoniae]HCM5830641.1 DNA repair protein RadC [Klebsiella pneumoniae]